MIEIERKFLVQSDHWRADVSRKRAIVQGYLSTTPEHTIRARISDETGILTIKGRAIGLVRREFEYEIPVEEARLMIDEMCGGRVVDKTRHEVVFADHLWEIDEFHGANQGLVVAEVELGRPDEKVELPDWAGEEVTGEVRYYNARLAQMPYERWDDPSV